MLIKFDEIEEITIPHLKDGAGAVSAKMYMEPSNKIMVSRLPARPSVCTLIPRRSSLWK
ncbi:MULTISPECIES: hypothetical protein [Eubacterium]|uniref:hypothetical protein n=1 Tax=Eubacterium TaxID=1730 RepID=UPI001313EAC7|nr:MULTISPECIES: hypothetical protein [Eubacterium]